MGVTVLCLAWVKTRLSGVSTGTQSPVAKLGRRLSDQEKCIFSSLRNIFSKVSATCQLPSIARDLAMWTYSEFGTMGSLQDCLGEARCQGNRVVLAQEHLHGDGDDTHR